MKVQVFLLSVLLSFCANSQTCYLHPSPNFTVPSNINTSADFTGDGIADIATAGFSLNIYAGTGTGSFAPVVYYAHGLPQAGNQNADMTSADFNNDGKADVVIASYTNQVSVMLRNGSGFAAPMVYPILGTGVKLSVADLNNDGNQDIVVANDVNYALSVMINNGSGIFSVVNYTIPVTPFTIALNDFNNDGNKDIGLGHASGGLLIYMNLGSGQFSPTSTLSIPTPSNCSSLRSADFNNDGNNDLAAALFNGNLQLFNGNGAGSFSLAATYSIGTFPQTTEIADMNGDNNIDIVSSDGFDVVNVFLNNGFGNFSRTSWVAPHYFSDITLRDFTGDGRADIVGTMGGGSGRTGMLVNNGTGRFLTTSAFKVDNIGSNYSVAHLTKGDMNNDGNLDIITADYALGSFSILYGTGSGSFSVISHTTNIVPLAATAADFNGDGNLDVAIVGYTNTLLIYMNAGAGAFTLNATYATALNPNMIKAADLNNDGIKDLVISNYGGNSFSVRLGNGNGTFGSLANHAVGSNSNGIDIADFNNDGNKDVAVAIWNNFVRVYPGSSNGTFSSFTSYNVNSNPSGIAAGDFNADGFADLAISCQFSNNFAVKLNNGSGSFGASTYYNIGVSEQAIIAGDYNQDGNIDLATGSLQGVGKLQIYHGNGAGAFGIPVPYSLGEDPWYIVSGDFNNDGRPDFAGACENYVSVLFTSFTPTISVSSATTACAFAPLTLTASGATTYYWSGTTSGSGSVAVAYPSSNSTYTITGINSPLCPASVIRSVSIIPSPTVTIASTSSSLCNGGSATLSASGAVTYTWSTGFVGSTIVLSPSVTNIYTVSGTASNACMDTVGKILTVYPLPTITVSGPASVCANASASLYAMGANSYTWSTSATASLVIVSPTVNTCYFVIGTSSVGCINLANHCMTVIASPSLAISPPSATVCLGTSQTFSASGAATYTWMPNINTASLNALVLASQIYTLFGSVNGCLDSSYVNLSVNPACADVWPGDANSDGIVDPLDVFEIGLSFSNTGMVRGVQGNTYNAHYASVWSGTVSTGKNKCHADCNGDGVVNFSDTLAISNNFSLSHVFKPLQNNNAADISLVSSTGDLIMPGAWNKLEIWISDISTPVTIYGTAFGINYDQSLLETDSVSIKYVQSFVNQGLTNVEFRKLNFLNGIIYGATVRTNGANVSGGGKIGEFYFKTKPDLADGTTLNVSIGNGAKVLASGTSTTLNGNNLALTVSQALGLNKGTSIGAMAFYPNPAVNRVTCVAPFESEVSYDFSDVYGRSVLQGIFVKQKTIDVSALSAGSYILTFKSGQALVRSKIIIRN